MKINIVLIEDIRSFNRFYTRVMGLLDQHILDSGYSLTEARVLFELKKEESCTANMLINQLKIDPSYMSRIIARFQKDNLITKEVSKTDSRARFIKLSEHGTNVINDLIEQSNEQIEKLLAPLSEDNCKKVTEAMKTIEQYLSSQTTDHDNLRIKI